MMSKRKCLVKTGGEGKQVVEVDHAVEEDTVHPGRNEGRQGAERVVHRRVEALGPEEVVGEDEPAPP